MRVTEKTDILGNDNQNNDSDDKMAINATGTEMLAIDNQNNDSEKQNFLYTPRKKPKKQVKPTCSQPLFNRKEGLTLVHRLVYTL